MIDDNQISTKEIEGGKVKEKDAGLLVKRADTKKQLNAMELPRLRVTLPAIKTSRK
ncbi:hypothetical protein [Alkalimarinus coralli]|uniref:hypothetical protein n=1 Tax=Alkalimarinus coralli TaxID=2935863 RepID=UPI00202AD67D|nr:hypothetical protein [Alkalimarinus coralli]